MNKLEAAEALGLSPRSINRAITAGKLHVTYVKSGKSSVATFDPAEVEALKNAPATVPAAKSQALTHSRDRSIELTELLERLLTNGKPTVPVEAKLLLTIVDAASLTSLSKQRLRAAIGAGTLKASMIGKGWKVKRSDLESFIQDLE